MKKLNYKDILLLVTAAFILPLAAFIFWKIIDRQSDPPIFYSGKKVDIFSLINQRSEIETPVGWKGKIVVVNFFFTHCPTICPVVMRNMQEVQKKYGDDTLMQFVSFTVDPERDSIARFREYIRTMHIDDTRWDFVTGEKKVIYSLARNGFRVVAAKGGNTEDDFIHSDDIVLMDTEGKIRGYYAGTKQKQIEQLISDIKKIHL